MQYGHALSQILHTIVHADPRHGPLSFIKIDIADGFNRVWLAASNIPKLGVAYPSLPGEPLLVAFPLFLPMGWVKSISYFTVVTETICDLANMALRTSHHLPPPHHLDFAANTRPPATTPCPIHPPSSHMALHPTGYLSQTPGCLRRCVR